MLDLDLDLEADLGIDTVKQAEMFASVRAAFHIPRDANLKLRDFPTLAHVIQFAQRARRAPARARILPSFEASDRVPRRVPAPRMRPPLDLCKPTGVILGPGSRVVLMPDQAGVGGALEQQLQSMGAEVFRIDGAPDAESLAGRLEEWMAAGPVTGVYWLPALDHEGSISGMNGASWHEALRVRVKLLYTTMRALYQQVARPDTFLVSATRLGGQHGYDEAGAFAPMGGARDGLHQDLQARAGGGAGEGGRFRSGRATPSEIAGILIAETLRDPGAVEIGHTRGQRWTIGLEEQPVADGQPGMTLDKDTVFVITGAAGSIVSAITADLAAASGGTFYLLDLAPEPDPANPDLERFANDREGLKRDLFARIQARGERATPALVEKELAALERAHAARSCHRRRARRGRHGALLCSVNLTDAAGCREGDRPGARAQRAYRRAAARRRNGAQPLPAG